MRASWEAERAAWESHIWNIAHSISFKTLPVDHSKINLDGWLEACAVEQLLAELELETEYEEAEEKNSLALSQTEFVQLFCQDRLVSHTCTSNCIQIA